MLMKLEVMGETILNRDLMRWEERAGDFLPVFAALVVDFHAMEAKQFASEGAPSGGWAVLADSTIAQRAAMGLGANPILDRSGATYRGREGGTGRRSLTESNAPYSVTRVTPDEMFVGSSDPVMGYHQRGHETPTPLPQRRVVEFREADRVRWVKAMQAHLTGTPLSSVLAGPRGL